MEHTIIPNVNREQVKFYVLVDESQNKVIAIITAEGNEDVKDKVCQAILEDVSAEEVEVVRSRNYEGSDQDHYFTVQITEDGNDVYEVEYNLILTTKY